MTWDETDAQQLLAIAKAINAAADDARITEAHRDQLLRDIRDIGELLNLGKFGEAEQEKNHLSQYMKHMKFM